MTFSDYLLDIALLALVFRQIRESRLGWHAILLPIGICTVVGAHYLQGLPTGGADLVLIAGLTAVGVVLGLVSALATRIRRDADGHALVKAGWVAAGAWVLGMGSRFAFSVWVAHGGAGALGRFSAAHHITTAAAWTDALVLMAFGEVFVRTGVLVLRAARTRRPVRPAPSAELVTV
jgi:hypothetical protein